MEFHPYEPQVSLWFLAGHAVQDVCLPTGCCKTLRVAHYSVAESRFCRCYGALCYFQVSFRASQIYWFTSHTVCDLSDAFTLVQDPLVLFNHSNLWPTATLSSQGSAQSEQLRNVKSAKNTPPTGNIELVELHASWSGIWRKLVPVHWASCQKSTSINYSDKQKTQYRPFA